jgi:hypothetical protein
MTEIQIDGPRFLIDGKPTYEGVTYRGKPVEGLLMNSRMVQAIFDDENPETAALWRYPDTGRWDPDRNTDEFCAALPEYHRYGLLAMTVGLQGGGSIYRPEVYDNYINSAFRPDGTLKPAYFHRLKRVLEAADAAGMVVIVNYFYWKQAARMEEGAVRRAAEATTDWLLRTGHRNILVDVMNEASHWEGIPSILCASNAHLLIEIVQQITLDGRRLLVGASTLGGAHLPAERWQKAEDFHMPHGNGCTPDELRAKLQKLKDTDELKKHPRPILVNEDSVFVENMEAAVDEYVSWGFYCQGYGCHYRDRMDWTTHGRERRYEDLSGFQTVPVNWSINTPIKRAFFERLSEITGGR